MWMTTEMKHLWSIWVLSCWSLLSWWKFWILVHFPLGVVQTQGRTVSSRGVPFPAWFESPLWRTSFRSTKHVVSRPAIGPDTTGSHSNKFFRKDPTPQSPTHDWIDMVSQIQCDLKEITLEIHVWFWNTRKGEKCRKDCHPVIRPACYTTGYTNNTDTTTGRTS